VAFTDTMLWEQGNLKVTGKIRDLSLKKLFFALDLNKSRVLEYKFLFGDNSNVVWLKT
jgi:hypothetical protein